MIKFLDNKLFRYLSIFLLNAIRASVSIATLPMLALNKVPLINSNKALFIFKELFSNLADLLILYSLCNILLSIMIVD